MLVNPGVNLTERIFNPQTVCVPATGVYIARALPPDIPGTVAEVLALAEDMGAPNTGLAPTTPSWQPAWPSATACRAT